MKQLGPGIADSRRMGRVVQEMVTSTDVPRAVGESSPLVEGAQPGRRGRFAGRGRRGQAGLEGPRPAAAGVVGARTRSPLRIALALLFIALVGVSAAALYSKSHQGIAVAVTAKDLPAGHVITAADLTQGQVSSSDQSFAATRWDRAASLVGQVTVSAVPNHTLLTSAMVGSRIATPHGTRAVGLKVAAGQIPTEVVAGSRVLVVSVPARAGTSTSGGATVAAGTVLSVGTDDTGSGSTLVTVAVPWAVSGRVAALGSMGQLALVMAGS